MNDAGWLDQVAAWLLVDENLEHLTVDDGQFTSNDATERASSVDRGEDGD
jgi:hypothetical protein